MAQQIWLNFDWLFQWFDCLHQILSTEVKCFVYHHSRCASFYRPLSCPVRFLSEKTVTLKRNFLKSSFFFSKLNDSHFFSYLCAFMNLAILVFNLSHTKMDDFSFCLHLYSFLFENMQLQFKRYFISAVYFCQSFCR